MDSFDQTAHELISYEDLSQRDVRSLLFHLLYAAESLDYQESTAAIIDNFNRGFNLNIPINGSLAIMLQEIVDQRDTLDEIYKPFLDNWRFERISVAVKLILRFAVWELGKKETDPRIIINEAIELTKAFAEKDAYRFVNGILDKLVKSETI